MLWVYCNLGSFGILRSIYFTFPGQISIGYNEFIENRENYSYSYLKYIMDNQPLNIFQEPNHLLETFLNNYFIKNKSNQKLDYSFFEYAKILNKNNPSGKDVVDKEFLDLVFINKAFEENDTVKAFNIYERLNMKNVLLPSFSESKTNRYLIKQLAVNLAVNNKYDESMKIINAMEPAFKRNILIDIVEELHFKGAVQNAPLYLDEFFKSSNELQTHYGMKIYKDIAMIGTKQLYEICESGLKDLPSLLKSRGHLNYLRGMMYNNNYYMASQNVSDMVSSSRELQLYNEIIGHYIYNNIAQVFVEDIDSGKLAKVFNDKGWEEYDANFQSSIGADYESIFGEDLKIDLLE